MLALFLHHHILRYTYMIIKKWSLIELIFLSLNMYLTILLQLTLKYVLMSHKTIFLIK